MANLPPIKIYWHAPAPLFAARVNMPSGISYPIQDINYDGVTVGSYTDLAADMFFTLGSAPNLDDYGRGRLRAAPTATVLKVGRSSQGTNDGELNVVDNAWIYVYADYRVHSKTPAIVNYTEYKDGDLAVSDRTQEPPPQANMGPDRAWRIDATSGLARFYFDGSGSYAVADGATITGYAWDIDDGAYALGTGATDSGIYADFAAGVRYVSLTVTDSNGKSHTTRRLVLADDPDDSLCVSGMQLANLTRTKAGVVARLRVLQDLPRADFPDGGHVLGWEDRDPAIYGSPDPTDWSNMLHSGWHQTDQASSAAQELYLRRETELTCVDVAGRLDSLPGFDQRIEKPDDDGVWTWGEMATPNMDKFLHYLIHWHSTAASVADFYPSGTWDDYPFVIFDAVGDTLYNQLSRQANRLVPDHEFTCDRYGRLAVTVNPQFQDAADRTAVIHNSVTEQGWSAIEFDYTRPPRVYLLRGSAVLTGTDYNADGEIDTVFCVAPGTAQGQGAREQTLGERLAQSQTTLNSVVGHHYANLNARYGDITLTLNSNADPWDFDPAALTWVELHVPAEVAPQRGIDFEVIRCLCKEVSIDYTYAEEGTTTRARVTLEVETVGLPALTEEQEEALPVGQQPVGTVPPDFGLITGQEQVALINLDGYIYRTSDFQTASGSGGPTWDRVTTGITETIYSWVVDPFSPGYIDGVGSIDGWIATETDIYRVEDIFGTTPTVTSVLTFATSATAASFHWRSVQASFGRFFSTDANNPWLLCVSYYGDTTGHSGTWATYSVDAGATWSSEVQIGAAHASGTPTRFNPIGVYASPKTPGLAYTAAHVPVDDPLLPVLGTWPDGGTRTIVGAGNQITWQATISSSSGGLKEAGNRAFFAPPPDAVRVEMQLDWTFTTEEIGSGSGTAGLFDGEPTNITRTGSLGITHPGDTGTTSGTLHSTWTKTGTADWPGNNTVIESAADNEINFIRIYVNANGGYITTVTVTMTITEIELEDSTIYTPGPGTAAAGFVSEDYGATWAQSTVVQPGEAQAGSVHLPWEDNDAEALAYFGALDTSSGTRQFRLKQNSGGTLSDISPSDGTRSYGVNKFGFAIRAYDSNRQYLLASVIGNDSSGDAADDLHAVYVSSNAGGTWSEVVAPTADDAGFADRPAYEAAFSGSDSDEIYIWGPPGYISYSADGGSTADSRAGNLSTFSPAAAVGIAGGPNGSE